LRVEPLNGAFTEERVDRVATAGRAVWYICAMMCKGLAICAALLAALLLAAAAGAGQTNDRPGASRQAPPPAAQAPQATSNAVPQAAGSPVARTDCEGGNCDYQTPHITVATAAPAPAQWSWQERISWAANLVLALLGYAGIMLALSLLKKIERQTKYGEAAAAAAAENARAALLHAEAIVRSERPWILITVEPTRGVENGFTVTATNRGRSPARIAAMADEIRIAIDESHLPSLPEYRHTQPVALLVPILLLPGESAGIKGFCRDDVKALCESEERFKRVEEWGEKIFLYGRVFYTDLIAPSGDATHETGWCCWYIHGRQKSGMVMAGPPAYNHHT
jgi:hypothetical protein